MDEHPLQLLLLEVDLETLGCSVVVELAGDVIFSLRRREFDRLVFSITTQNTGTPTSAVGRTRQRGKTDANTLTRHRGHVSLLSLVFSLLYVLVPRRFPH